MALQSMWVHGNGATIQLNQRGRGSNEDLLYQWTAEIGARSPYGLGYVCQRNSDYWFHFPIPTPSIVNGIRVRLRRATVLFNGGSVISHIQLSSLHVWDGPNRVFARDGLAIGGENYTPIDERNSFALPDTEVFFGTGISVQFHFFESWVLSLRSAGIEFEV